MADTQKVDKNCEDCGALMVGVTPKKRLCPDCVKRRSRDEKRTYKTMIRKEKPVVLGTPIRNPNAKHCKGCVYWQGSYEGFEVCNYIFFRDQRRPCPPGKDCTEKVLGKRKRSRNFVIKEG